MIAGMPGIGGSLGECQVCGRIFLAEIVMNSGVLTGRVPGIDCDLAVHRECAKLLTADRPWAELPEGPIRRAFAEANEPNESEE